MGNEIKETALTELIGENRIFRLVTWLNGTIGFTMCILSLVVNLKWYITFMLFISSLLAAIFFFAGRKNKQTERTEILFLALIYMIVIPAGYIAIGLEICEIPIYFVLGIIFSSVILKGRKRMAMLLLQLTEYSAAIWYVTMAGSAGVYDTSGLPVDIYIRLLLAVAVAGTAGGILLMYRNSLLLNEIRRSEEKSGRAAAANTEREVFMKNLSYELCTFLHKILNTTEMLTDMNIDVQRKEDILFIDNSARELLIPADRLGDEKEHSMGGPLKKKTESARKIICPQAAVLVVDDNIINLEIVKSMLEQYKCRIFGAMSGAECLAVMADKEPDIIFLDYMMPEMDGIETLERIRKTEGRLKDIPVVVLTADVVSGAKEAFIKAGFNDYMEKPVEMAKMQNVLETYLDKDKIVEVRDGRQGVFS